jgi:hypothetical protein
MDDRLICIAGKVKVGDEIIDLRFAIKYDKGTLPESFYEAIEGTDYEHGLKFMGVVHGVCEVEKK